MKFKLAGSMVGLLQKSESIEKSGEDSTRHVRGIISTDAKDRQKEQVIQQGLEFGPMLAQGFINDDHKNGLCDRLGRPTYVASFAEGDNIVGSDGEVYGVASRPTTYMEGYLFKSHNGSSLPSDKFWEMLVKLREENLLHTVGWSIEGSVLHRSGAKGEKIAEALVSNVALTSNPVNTDTSILLKALSSHEEHVEDEQIVLDLSLFPECIHNALVAFNSKLSISQRDELNKIFAMVPGQGLETTPENLEGTTVNNTFMDFIEQAKKSVNMNASEKIQLFQYIMTVLDGKQL